MSGTELPLDRPELRVTSWDWGHDAVTIHVESTSPGASCPRCRRHSMRVHSRYLRTLADQPIRGRRTFLRVNARRFFCDQPECPRAVFCERFSELTTAHARTTGPLAESHQAIGFALGGEAGSRLAERLALPTSPDTLLRRVKAAPEEPLPPARYVGVDDWATRKGHHYGTILIDLERHRVIDILPERDAVALKKWLEEHPGVEIVTRDRWPAFADAVRDAAPDARQVADRWHLLKNLREAVERVFARFSAEIREIAQPNPPTETPTPSTEGGSPSPAIPVPTEPTSASSPERISHREQLRRARHGTREQQHRRVRELQEQGYSIRETARQLGMPMTTVARYRHLAACPDWNPGRKEPSLLDEHRGLIDEWINGGGRMAMDLHRLLAAKGVGVSYECVRRYLTRKLGSLRRTGRQPSEPSVPQPAIPSSRKLSFQFICPPKGERVKSSHEATKPSVLDRLRANIPDLKAALDVASEFASMVRREVSLPLSEWLTKAESSGVRELQNFARGLREDEAAVTAAMTESME